MTSEFDQQAAAFSERMRRVADWRHSEFGAAYSTRMKQAIERARHACNALEAFLKKTGE